VYIVSVVKLRCLGHKRFLPVRRSARGVILGVIRMSQRSQIEWLKFSRLSNRPLITGTDQCEYYCFHILCSFFVFRSPPCLVRPSRDNHPFLFPIRKSDVGESLAGGISGLASSNKAPERTRAYGSAAWRSAALQELVVKTAGAKN
jgi:hypothetical protein